MGVWGARCLFACLFTSSFHPLPASFFFFFFLRSEPEREALARALTSHAVARERALQSFRVAYAQRVWRRAEAVALSAARSHAARGESASRARIKAVRRAAEAEEDALLAEGGGPLAGEALGWVMGMAGAGAADAQGDWGLWGEWGEWGGDDRAGAAGGKGFGDGFSLPLGELRPETKRAGDGGSLVGASSGGASGAAAPLPLSPSAVAARDRALLFGRPGASLFGNDGDASGEVGVSGAGRSRRPPRAGASMRAARRALADEVHRTSAALAALDVDADALQRTTGEYGRQSERVGAASGLLRRIQRRGDLETLSANVGLCIFALAVAFIVQRRIAYFVPSFLSPANLWQLFWRGSDEGYGAWAQQSNGI